MCIKDHKTDIAIIGSGPVGLFAIFQAGMLKLHTHVIDNLDFIGGQCSALYPEKPIYDIPAYPVIEALELINKLEDQAKPFHPVYHLGEQVVALEKKAENDFLLTTSSGKKINSKAVIIAGGCGAFGPNRPPLNDIEKYEGKSVFYMVGAKEQFRDKTIVIAGGGDSAVDWAISLAGIAKYIYVVHRRNKFRCAPESHERLMSLVHNNLIELVVPYQLDSLEGEGGNLERVIVKDLENNTRILSAECLLPFYGLKMELGPINDWGLNLHKHHIEVDPSTMQTNLAGVFAIGDIASYKGKLKLILTGFSEAAVAAHHIYKRLHPDHPLHFEYSTSKGIQTL